jgi:hypothetical protein
LQYTVEANSAGIYTEVAPVVLIRKNESGADQICINGSRKTSTPLSKSRLQSIIDKINYFFQDATQKALSPSEFKDGQGSIMTLTIESGSHKSTFTKVTHSPDNDIAKEFFRFIWDISEP